MRELYIAKQELTIGIGDIGPRSHIDKHEYGWNLVDDAERDIVYDMSLQRKLDIGLPIQCADGRTILMLGCSAIGGSYSIVMMDACGPRIYYNANDNAYNHGLIMYKEAANKDLQLGGHDDDHAHSPNCGCGGQDRIKSYNTNDVSILQLLDKSSDPIRLFCENLQDSSTGQNLGIRVPDWIHQTITDHSADLNLRSASDRPYAVPGVELREALIQSAGVSAVDTLRGQHNEAVAIIDLRKGINGQFNAFDRAMFARRYNGLMQAFYISAVGLRFAARNLFGESKDKQDLAYYAGLYYNLAAAAVLADSELRVVTLTDHKLAA